jgi:SAM-dependent methyltransferase
MTLQAAVQAYYGQELSSSADLKTTACCDADAVPAWLRPLLAKVHPEVSSRYYGCGLVCPAQLSGCRILDLGSGSGRDAYLLSQLVGPRGSIVGVDMTAEQLAIARQYTEFHAQQFGYANVSFLNGTIEKLEDLDLEPESFDVIISNCVLNLSTDKAAVLQGVQRLLKPGGEFYFADVYTDRRLPEAVRRHPVLYGECLGGALYWQDFLRMARSAGFPDPRLVSNHPISITDPKLAPLVGLARFESATYRLFKINGLEEACEDYGQAVIYRGTLPQHPDRFPLDHHHVLETGRTLPVCGNTYRLLHQSRFQEHFDFSGDFSRHFGPFPGCGSPSPFNDQAPGAPTPAPGPSAAPTPTPVPVPVPVSAAPAGCC